MTIAMKCACKFPPFHTGYNAFCQNTQSVEQGEKSEKSVTHEWNRERLFVRDRSRCSRPDGTKCRLIREASRRKHLVWVDTCPAAVRGHGSKREWLPQKRISLDTYVLMEEWLLWIDKSNAQKVRNCLLSCSGILSCYVVALSVLERTSHFVFNLKKWARVYLCWLQLPISCSNFPGIRIQTPRRTLAECTVLSL